MNDNKIIDLYINEAEDERTVMTKISSRMRGASQSTQPVKPHVNPSQSPSSYSKERMLDTHFQQ